MFQKKHIQILAKGDMILLGNVFLKGHIAKPSSETFLGQCRRQADLRCTLMEGDNVQQQMVTVVMGEGRYCTTQVAYSMLFNSLHD